MEFIMRYLFRGMVGMGNDAQFKKGVLEMCVLVLLGEKDRYGYELVQDISVRFEISEGSIYPLLKRLRDEGVCDYILAGVCRRTCTEVLWFN